MPQTPLSLGFPAWSGVAGVWLVVALVFAVCVVYFQRQEISEVTRERDDACAMLDAVGEARAARLRHGAAHRPPTVEGETFHLFGGSAAEIAERLANVCLPDRRAES